MVRQFIAPKIAAGGKHLPSDSSRIHALSHGRRARLAYSMLLGAAALMASSRTFGQAPRFQRWEIDATVYRIEDPQGAFSDVRLGDPVHGTLTVDFGCESDALSHATLYWPATTFDVATMTIENPRTGGRLQFKTAEFNNSIWIFNDVVDPPNTVTYDDVLGTQLVAPPPGYTTTGMPLVGVELISANALSDTGLPRNLNLDDWPDATIYFTEGNTLVDAEIYSLTPVPVMFAPGDFNGDKQVDAADFTEWQRWFGINNYADANGDAFTDAADYVLWRKNRVNVTNSIGDHPVPEPSTSRIAVGVLLFAFQQRKHFGKVLMS